MRRYLITGIAAYFVLAACGQGGSFSRGIRLGAGDASLYDEFGDSNAVRFLGDPRTAIVSPDPGIMTGPILLRFLQHPDAKIWLDIGGTASGDPEEPYSGPLFLIPPVSVRYQIEYQGQRGDITEVQWQAESLVDFAERPSRARIPLGGNVEATKLKEIVPIERQVQSTKEISLEHLKIDGQGADWPTHANVVAARDVELDMPGYLAHADLKRVSSVLHKDDLYLKWETRSPPSRRRPVVYGADLGTSQVTSADFGAGAIYKLRLEVRDGQAKIYDLRQDPPLAMELAADAIEVALDRIVELRLSFAALNIDISDDLIVRPFAGDYSRGVGVFDRMLPLYVRSPLHRVAFATSENNAQTITLLADTNLHSEPFIDLHAQLASQFADSLPKLNGFPLFGYGEIPIVHSQKVSGGFAGLNTTDRGVLSTYGPLAGRLQTAQLVAHEIAHFQNAGYAKFKARWLQEAMSEWSAERLLYQHYPRQAVYSYMRKLRVQPMLEALARDGLDDQYLDEWGSDQMGLGYEKSYMFLTLLDYRLGSATVREAFRRTFNSNLDSAGFQRVLEDLAGEDLDDLFRYWVFPGSPSADTDPRYLFSDPDSDGLGTLDELLLGSHPELADTDGDGYLDGEEYFAGRSPTVGDRDVTSGAVIDVMPASAISPIVRLAAEARTSLQYSFGLAAATDGHEFAGTFAWRPPYSMQIYAEADGGSTSLAQVDRPLQRPANAGTQVLDQGTASDGSGLLPIPARSNDTFGSISVSQMSGSSDRTIRDHVFDLPDEFGAFDLKQARVRKTSAGLSISLQTRSALDDLSDQGRFIVTFETLTFDQTATSEWHGTLQIERGRAYWDATPSRQAEVLDVHVKLHYGDEMNIELSSTLLSDWLAASALQKACISSVIRLPDSQEMIDRLGCVTLGHAGVSRYSAQISDRWNWQMHSVDVYVASATDPALGNYYARLIAAALPAMESLIGRPIWERGHWDLHLTFGTSTAASAVIDRDWGVFLRALTPDSSIPEFNRAAFGYMLVEQMSKLLLQDIAVRLDQSPELWIQEFTTAWLTQSVMHSLTNTEDARAFSDLFRVGHFNCYYHATCPDQSYYISAYPDESASPLSAWTSAGERSLKGQKALMLAMVLDSQLGTDVIAQVVHRSFNHLPSTDELKLWLDGLVDSEQASLDATWAAFVTGTNTATQKGHFLRGANGLFVIENEKLTRLGVNPMTYLP